MQIIHIQLANAELGPYSAAQLRDFLAKGDVMPSDPARLTMDKDWATVEEVMAHLPAPIFKLTPIGQVSSQSNTPAPAPTALAQPDLFAPVIPRGEIQVEPIEPQISKERDITPPPEPIVPYNQPMPMPHGFLAANWHAWGKYAAIVLVPLAIWAFINWSTLGPAVQRYWHNFQLGLQLDPLSNQK